MTDLDKKQQKKTRIAIVDDHPLLRQALKELIDRKDDMVVCGEFQDGRSMLNALDDAQPDMAIIDINMDGMNGVELIKHLRSRDRHLHILVLTMYDENIYAERCLRAGARGYVTKAENPRRIIEAVRKLRNGELFISDSIASTMLKRVIASDGSPQSMSPLHLLSDRELEVYELTGKNLSMQEIAEKLCISINTVKYHKTHIKEKLQLGSTREIIRHAAQTCLQ